MTDEQRFDAVGWENPSVKTPCLDALALDSMVFRRAYTTNPSCIPARAAIFTGRYPSQCGVPTYISCLPESEKTFMSILRNNGYHTSVIGKQHFSQSKIFHGYDEEETIDLHSPQFMAPNKDST